MAETGKIFDADTDTVVVVAGVDTHLDTNMAAALNGIGGELGVREFPTTAAGYRALLAWLENFGTLAGRRGGQRLLWGRAGQIPGPRRGDGDRGRLPEPSEPPTAGKNDPIDALSAARATLSGDAAGLAKARNGAVEMIRVLRVARNSARRDRTEALNQLRSLVATAPDDVRQQLRDLSGLRLIEVTAAVASRRQDGRPVGHQDRPSGVGRRAQYLGQQMDFLNDQLRPLVTAAAPALLAAHGVGTDTAGALLVAAGDNPDRLGNQAAFAHLCGASPIEASSGKVTRHRLNRGGDRQANAALWRIVMVRMVSDPDTRAYVERRTKEGKSKREIMRCLKRYVARDSSPYSPK